METIEITPWGSEGGLTIVSFGSTFVSKNTTVRYSSGVEVGTPQPSLRPEGRSEEFRGDRIVVSSRSPLNLVRVTIFPVGTEYHCHLGEDGEVRSHYSVSWSLFGLQRTGKSSLFLTDRSPQLSPTEPLTLKL